MNYDIDDPSVLEEDYDDHNDNYDYYKNVGTKQLENVPTKVSGGNPFDKNKLAISKELVNISKKVDQLTSPEPITLITTIPIENKNQSNNLYSKMKAESTNKAEAANSHIKKNQAITIKSGQQNKSISSGKIQIDCQPNKSQKPPIKSASSETTVYSQMNQFDKMLNSNLDSKPINSSVIQEEDDNNQYDQDVDNDLLKEEITNLVLIEKTELHSRYVMLQKKYAESQTQISHINQILIEERNKQKELVDLFSQECSSEIKDKKLLELAKKNSELNLKVERMRLRVKELEKQTKSMEAQIVGLTSSSNTNGNNRDYCGDMLKESAAGVGVNRNNSYLAGKENDAIFNVNEEVINLKKKSKQLESRIAELSNKNQQLKSENSKMDALLRREIGENYDLDKEKVWKGRAEQLESLKGKIKLYEQIINNGNFQSNTAGTTDVKNEGELGTIDQPKNIIPLSLTNNHISKLSNNNIPFTQYKKEKESMKSEISNLTIEKDKHFGELQKMKLRKDVLEKELRLQKENLTSKIKLLLEKSDNDEKIINVLNKELEKKTGRSITGEDVMFNMKQEILSLREKLRIKSEDYEKLEKQIGGYNNKNSNVSLLGLLERIEILESENRELKANSEDGKIYETLARENASLRLKLYQKEK